MMASRIRSHPLTSFAAPATTVDTSITAVDATRWHGGTSGGCRSAGTMAAVTFTIVTHMLLVLLLQLKAGAWSCSSIGRWLAGEIVAGHSVVVHEPGHVVLDSGPGLRISVTELLQNQLVSQGPGYAKPDEDEQALCIAQNL